MRLPIFNAQLLAVFGLLLLILILIPSTISVMETNLRTLHLSMATVDASSNLPWTDPQWWLSTCQTGSDTTGPQDQLDATIRQGRQTLRLTALSFLVAGDCERAIDSLQQIRSEFPPASPEMVILAYLYSMQGAWIEAMETYPWSQLPLNLWKIRNYWADVSLRAANDARRIGDQGMTQKWLLAAEDLAAHQNWRGSQALADYWERTNHPVQRFEEMRRALALSKADTAYTMADKYIQARSAYLHEQSMRDIAGISEEILSGSAQDLDSRVEILSLQPNPAWQVGYHWNNQWQFIGADINEMALSLGPLVETTFFWIYAAMPGAAPTYVADHRLAYNMIPDAGFEWTPASQHVRPFGYLPRLYAEKPPLPYEIVSNENNQYFCLENTGESPNAGVLTTWGELTSRQTGARIFQGGMFRTMEDGKAHMGWRWRSSENDQVHFAHLVSGEQASKWQRATQVWEIPANANQIAFHLLQFQNQGRACFDDLFAFELRLPEVPLP